jgi:integrase
VCRGYLDERSAYREMARVIADVEVEQQIAPTKREARFEDAVEAWFAHLEFEKRAKPSTLAGYRNLLAPPHPGERGQRGARIMREFAGRKLRSIMTQDIQRFLAGIDREDVSARTVNIHRQLLHSIFEHARRNDVFALRDNPVAGTRKRPEEGARPIETFEPDELRAIAEAAARACTAPAPPMATPRRRTPSGSASTSRTPRSSSSPPVRGCGWASSSPSAGQTSTSEPGL